MMFDFQKLEERENGFGEVLKCSFSGWSLGSFQGLPQPVLAWRASVSLS